MVRKLLPIITSIILILVLGAFALVYYLTSINITLVNNNPNLPNITLTNPYLWKYNLLRYRIKLVDRIRVVSPKYSLVLTPNKKISQIEYVLTDVEQNFYQSYSLDQLQKSYNFKYDPESKKITVLIYIDKNLIGQMSTADLLKYINFSILEGLQYISYDLYTSDNVSYKEAQKQRFSNDLTNYYQNPKLMLIKYQNE